MSKTKTTKQNKGPIKLYGSQAEQWSKCAAAVNYSKSADFFGDAESLEKAELGNLIHKLAENKLTNQTDSLALHEYVTLKNHEEKVKDYLEFYFARLQSDFESAEGEKDLQIERRIEVKLKGAVIICRLDALLLAAIPTVYDLKTGSYEVKADRSLQLVVYAQAVARELKLRPGRLVRVCIVQPSLKATSYHYVIVDPDFFSSFTIPVPSPKNRHSLGPHCRFCQVNDVCKSFSSAMREYLNPKYLDKTLDRSSSWSSLLNLAKPITTALEGVERRATEAAQFGLKIEGYALEKRNTRRMWATALDAIGIAKFLGLKKTDVVKETLETPKQIEEKLKTKAAKEKFATLITQPVTEYLRRVDE